MTSATAYGGWTSSDRTSGNVSFIARPIVRRLYAEDVIGRVHSVFDRAVNVITPTNDFIAILGSNVGKTPMSLGVDDATTTALFSGAATTRLLGVGDEMVHRGDCFALGNIELAWDVKGTCVWEPRVEVAGVSHMTAAEIVPLLQKTFQHRIAAGHNDGFGAVAQSAPAFGRAMAAARSSFVWEWRRALHSFGPSDGDFESGGVLEGLARLVGLGPGLTPAGDDFLIGWIASLRLVGGTAEILVARLRETIERIAFARTNRLSAQYIRHALANEWSEPLGNLIQACQSIENRHGGEFVLARRNVVGAAHDVMRIGASSGMDTILGFVSGLEVSTSAAST